MHFPRSCGLLLHPTSLPGGHGIGDLGTAAREFLEFLVASDQQYWQVLPLGPTGFGNSPYMCYSAMAGNPLLISLDELVKEGWLTAADLAGLRFENGDRVDFEAVIRQKLPLLRLAAQRFQRQATPEDWQAFCDFQSLAHYWLPTYALFMALKDHHGGQPWYEWPAPLRDREPTALAAIQALLKERIFEYEFQQFLFYQQWHALKEAANQQGIQIIGDIPIYVAHDSADVWAFPQFFELNPETGAVALMAGVPPDYFSATGQLWGNPIYNWKALAADGYSWWIERFRVLLSYVDIIRLDHFRGFQAYWQVPAGEETAVNGEWQPGPGAAFFEALQAALGRLPILAEDLGDITPDVIALRDQFQFPGMKILQFAFGGGSDNPFLPFNQERNCVVYTGTHDNDTTVGWYRNLSDWERQRLIDYLGYTPSEPHWALIRMALGTVANQAIIPVQDLLGLDSHARMNFPGTGEGNWTWRLTAGQLTPELAAHLKHLVHLFGRQAPPRPQPVEAAEEAVPEKDPA
ncbi:MAG: 4-alpha-glucanotransferase [Thermosynechococcus sp.]